MKTSNSGSILLLIPIVALVLVAIIVTIKPYKNNEAIYNQVMGIISGIPGISKILPPGDGKLEIIESTLPSSKLITDPTFALEISFNKAVNPPGLQVTIQPFIPLDILPKQDHQIAISASTVWKDNQHYEIIIKEGSKARDGSSIGKDYIIEFETRLKSPLD